MNVAIESDWTNGSYENKMIEKRRNNGQRIWKVSLVEQMCVK